MKILNNINNIIRKGGRVVNCTNFENWRGFAVTEGSNPSLSVTNNKKILVFFYEQLAVGTGT